MHSTIDLLSILHKSVQSFPPTTVTYFLYEDKAQLPTVLGHQQQAMFAGCSTTGTVQACFKELTFIVIFVVRSGGWIAPFVDRKKRLRRLLL